MATADLGGKSIILTGAGRGLGRAMSVGLARAGATVTMVERDAGELEAAAAEAEKAAGQGSVLPVEADVTDERDAAMVVARTLDRFGKLTGLVNNAALGPNLFYKTNLGPKPKIWEADLDLWRQTVNVNGSGPFIMTQAAVPHMLEAGWGRVINVTTSLETMINAGIGPYGPAKACAEAFSRMLSLDLEGTGVTANVLIPGGPANTRMIIADGNRADRDRLIQPEVMVAPVCWLASEQSDGLNGIRFRAAIFDATLTNDEIVERIGNPIAWPQLAGDAIRPPGDEGAPR